MSEKDLEDSEQQNLESNPPIDHEYPEGGWRAWGTVLGAWLIQFCTFGYANAFGVYQDYYVRQYLSDYTSSQISWIGGLQTMLLFTVGLFAGRAFDLGYFYSLTICGTILFPFCLFMVSLSQQQSYYQIFLSQGLGTGIAFGVTFVPPLSIIGHYFRRRRALAMGIASSGSSIGGVVHPVMLNHLFYGSAGFHGGVRISAGLNLGLMAIALLLMRPRLPPQREGKFFSQIPTFFKDPPYVVVVFGASAALAGLVFPFFFVQLDAISQGVNSNLAFYTLVILNGVGAVGRVLAGYLADSVGVLNLVVATASASSILVFCMLAVHDVAGFISFSALFGLTSSAYISLLAPMLSVLARDVSEIGARMGFCFTVIGFAALISSPIYGALLSKSFIWWRPTVYSAICLGVAAVSYSIARYLHWRRRNQSDSRKISQII